MTNKHHADKGELRFNEIMEFLQENVATKEDIKDLRVDMGKLEKSLRIDMGKLEHRLRDYIDGKIFDLKGDLISIMRRGAKQATELIDMLRQKKVIDQDEQDYLLSLPTL